MNLDIFIRENNECCIAPDSKYNAPYVFVALQYYTCFPVIPSLNARWYICLLKDILLYIIHSTVNHLKSSQEQITSHIMVYLQSHSVRKDLIMRDIVKEWLSCLWHSHFGEYTLTTGPDASLVNASFEISLMNRPFRLFMSPQFDINTS